jgi:hypothetical protein
LFEQNTEIQQYIQGQESQLEIIDPATRTLKHDLDLLLHDESSPKKSEPFPDSGFLSFQLDAIRTSIIKSFSITPDGEQPFSISNIKTHPDTHG